MGPCSRKVSTPTAEWLATGGPHLRRSTQGVQPFRHPCHGLCLALSAQVKPRGSSVEATEQGHAATGFATTPADLAAAGFVPLALKFRPTSVQLPCGAACEWTTVGDVPTGPGLYAFTSGDDDLRVLYVGLTEELWMITKGRLPAGGARTGQRYGRPRYAGVTRQRVNALIAARVLSGEVIRHWVRPLGETPGDRAAVRRRLLELEEELIVRWNLRRVGWNRG